MSLTQTIQEVRDSLHHGVPFERVEAFIEEQDELDEEERSVVWLLAWFDGDVNSLTYELGRRLNITAKA